MNSDPRACKIPMTEFNHLSLSHVGKFERLDGILTPIAKRASPLYQHLLARRVFPDRGHNKGDAA